MKLRKASLLILVAIQTAFVLGQNSELDSLVSEGIMLHDQGEYQKAIETYEKALKIDPNSSLSNYEIAFSYLSSGDYIKAEEFSKKVIDHDIGHQLEAYICYGNALDLQGKPGKAIKVYEKAMENHDNYLIYYNHAITCFNNGKSEKAYESALKAIGNNPGHASSHLIISKIMDTEGTRIKAMLPLYYFLLIEPNSVRAAQEYQNLKNYLDYGVTIDSESAIHVTVPTNDDSDFGAAEMMISLSRASNSTEKSEGKSDLQLFAENNDNIFNPHCSIRVITS